MLDSDCGFATMFEQACFPGLFQNNGNDAFASTPLPPHTVCLLVVKSASPLPSGFSSKLLTPSSWHSAVLMFMLLVSPHARTVITLVQLKPGLVDGDYKTWWIAKGTLTSEMLKGRKSCISERMKYANQNVHCFSERKCVHEVPVCAK